MTVKQQQCLLYYLGYYVGNIDGIWGEQSQEATILFQDDYGLAVDGVFGSKTQQKILSVVANGEKPLKAHNWDDIKYFSKKEFACKCGKCGGYPAEIDMGMVKIADLIRERLGKPVGVNSGLRCRDYNRAVGGVDSSQHLFGTAADLGCPNGVKPERMAAIAQEIMGDTGGIGVYSWGIHIDTRKAVARWNG
jgi:hypothetical protein